MLRGFKKIYFPVLILIALTANKNIKAQGSGYTLPFDGIAGYISVAGVGLNAITNNFTIEMWIKPAAAITIQAQQNCPTCISGVGGMGQRYAVYPTWGGFANIAGAGISVGTNGIQVYEHANNYLPALLVYNAALPAGWNHIAVVYTNLTPSLYLNGVLVATGLTSQRTSVFPSANIAGPTYGFFSGNIDDFRIWNYSRTATQIRDKMCQKLIGNEVGLARYYRFDNGAGTVLTDATGNENGTVAGMGVAPGWLLSGAPIGDASAYTYTPGSWAGQIVTLPPAGNGTTFSVTTVAGNPTGVQVYQVNSVPNSTAGIIGIGTNNVYYGTFIVGGAGPTYNATINYTNYNPLPNVQMFTRADNSVSPWTAGPSNPAPPPYTITLVGANTRGEFIIGTTNSISPLPIDLLEFEAEANDDKVILNWQTVNEINNAFFTIEKSKDAVNFTKLIDVDASGNTHSINKYSEIDFQPFSGTSYYRLKQTNKDGSFTNYKIVSVNQLNDANLSVFPNPSETNGYLFIRINGLKGRDVFMKVQDSQGRIIFSKELKPEENSEVFPIEILKLIPPGFYFISTSVNNQTSTYKLIVK